MSNEEKKLKAKIDFNKTVFQTFFTAMIASMVATWVLWDNETTRCLFFLITIALAMGTAVGFYRYDQRHRELIDFLRK